MPSQQAKLNPAPSFLSCEFWALLRACDRREERAKRSREPHQCRLQYILSALCKTCPYCSYPFCRQCSCCGSAYSYSGAAANYSSRYRKGARALSGLCREEREVQSPPHRRAAENSLLPGVHQLHVADAREAGCRAPRWFRFGAFFHGEHQIVSVQCQSAMLVGTAFS